ncbi:hypothetical protein [Paludibacterium paludis]|uniref:Tox-HNH-HHH domain-containing protein n=1 Tax=Paludibacterium paludis TaxID=1225769 RepID=A0A918P5R9_9NEIS|nr:hypothetical protein [Paludibacterium paludis]GGY22936.1 hypothetical protein GCM10011289_28340 [Paludibacterium paludis]
MASFNQNIIKHKIGLLKLAAELAARFNVANAARIAAKQSPIVDDVWIKNFPEHSAYNGETLVHHHLDYGPKAIPLPGTVHSKQPGWGIWHPEHSGN